MTAFHFGSRQRRLFGYYEPAQANFSKVQAALNRTAPNRK